MNDASKPQGGKYRGNEALKQASRRSTVDDLAEAQKRIERLSGAGAPIVKAAFREAAAARIDADLMRGDPARIAELEKAGAKAMGLRGSADAASVIRRFNDTDASIDQVAAWLVGAARVMAPGRPAEVARRFKETMDKEDWQELRAAVVERLTLSVGATIKDGAEDYLKLIGGRAAPLLAVMFTPEERDLLRRLGNTAKLVGDQPPQVAARSMRPVMMELAAAVSPQ